MDILDPDILESAELEGESIELGRGGELEHQPLARCSGLSQERLLRLLDLVDGVLDRSRACDPVTGPCIAAEQELVDGLVDIPAVQRLVGDGMDRPGVDRGARGVCLLRFGSP